MGPQRRDAQSAMTAPAVSAAPPTGADDAAAHPVVIVGAGPGIGMAVARRFGAAGHPAGLIARDRGRLTEHVAELERLDITATAAVADARRPGDLRRALSELRDALGPAQILCFSPFPDVSLIKPVTDTTAEDVSAALQLNAVGAAAAVGSCCRRCGPGRRCCSPPVERPSTATPTGRSPRSPTAPRLPTRDYRTTPSHPTST